MPDAKRNKLDDRSRVMLFVGYHNIGAYKLYCYVTNKVEFNRDVIMKETKAWDQNKSQSNYGAVLTPKLSSEDISDSEREFASKRDSESEYKSEFECDFDVEVEFEDESDSKVDSKGESDFDLDFDDDTNTSGNHAYKGGHASKVRPDSKVILTSDIVPASEKYSEQVQRP